VWAFAVHYCGLATNNLLDLPFDRQDPNKQLFPLVSGRISERQAWIANGLAHLVAIGLPIALVGPDPHVIAWVLAGLAGGWAYCLTCKMHAWSPLWHTVFMAGLVLVPFVAYRATLTAEIVAFLLIMEFILMYQLMVEGPAKDAGVRQTPYDWSKLTQATRLGVALSWRAAAIVAALALAAWQPRVEVLLLAAAVLAIAVPTALRPASLKLFSVNEVTVFALMLVALLPLLGAVNALLLFVVPALWYLGCNRALWGRWSAPKI